MQQLGILGMVSSAVLFVYYTVWVLVAPFVPPEDPFHRYFPDKRFAFILPSFIVVTITTSAMGYLGYVLINSERYRKPMPKPWE